MTGPGVPGAARIGVNPHFQYALQAPDATARERRHARIEQAVVGQIAAELHRLALSDGRLLQIQPGYGQQILLYRDQVQRPKRPVIYDLHDDRDPETAADTDFALVDCEAAAFPAADDHFDVVIWNRELVTLKNALPALREARRVLRPGGVMILTLPNLAALHNRLVLLAGFQPTTLHITEGDHVRGFASRPMSKVLERDLGLRILGMTGVGLAPLSSRVQPRWLRSLSHTTVWVLRKPKAAEAARR